MNNLNLKKWFFFNEKILYSILMQDRDGKSAILKYSKERKVCRTRLWYDGTVSTSKWWLSVYIFLLMKPLSVCLGSQQEVTPSLQGCGPVHWKRPFLIGEVTAVVMVSIPRNIFEAFLPSHCQTVAGAPVRCLEAMRSTAWLGSDSQGQLQLAFNLGFKSAWRLPNMISVVNYFLPNQVARIVELRGLKSIKQKHSHVLVSIVVPSNAWFWGALNLAEGIWTECLVHFTTGTWRSLSAATLYCDSRMHPWRRRLLVAWRPAGSPRHGTGTALSAQSPLIALSDFLQSILSAIREQRTQNLKFLDVIITFKSDN